MKRVYLLDTNIVSELVKESPNFAVLQELHKNEGFCAICSTVWQEIIYGYEKMPEGKKKQEIAGYIDKLKETFDIIPYDTFAAEICGEIRAKCKKQGKPAPFFDSQIAATAIANGMILITHNTPDFEAMQENSMLKVEDWWNSSF